MAGFKFAGGGKSFSFTSTAPKPAHHGILHNLLSDTIDTAKGIVPGIVTSVEHPVRAAKGIAHAEAAMYSPLVHGQFGKFWANVHAHPLTPLLDLLTVGSLGAGGIGLGLKAGETSGLLARGSADVVRAGTEATMKDLPTGIKGLGRGEVAKHYSTNLFRHYLLQRPTEKAFESLGKMPIGKALFGEKGLHDMTPLGRGQRALAQRGSAHSAGTAFARNRQMGLVRHVLKTSDKSDPAAFNAAIGDVLHKGVVDSVFSHGMKVDAADAGHLRGHDWAYIKHVRPMGAAPEPTLASWAEHIKTHTPISITRDPAKALKDESGKLTVIHNTLRSQTATEASNGLKTLDVIYKQPTRLWKYLILAQAPRYFVNNVIGNSLMLTASTRPDRLVRGIYQAVSDVHGAKVAERTAKQAEGHLAGEQARLAGTWYHKYYAGPNAGPGSEIARVGNKIPHRITQGLYGATEKVAYRGTHMAGVNAAIMETPQWKAAYMAARHGGMGRTTAFRHAAEQASQEPGVRGFVSKKAADWAGQYNHSTPLENAVRNIVPFYSWDRHALRFAKEQALGRPGSSAVLAGVGDQGNKYVQQKLGNLPEFMRGAVPLGKHGGILGDILGGTPAGRDKVLLTNSLNPLGAASEDLNALAAIGGQQVGSKSEALGFQINPLVAGAISSLTGQKLGSGAPVHYKGGVVGGALSNTFSAVPFAKLAQSLVQPQGNTTSKGKPTLYTHGVRQQIDSLLGLPTRDVSREAAAISVAKAVAAATKKKKKATFGYGG